MCPDSRFYHVRPCGDADIEAVVTLWEQLPGLVLRAEDAPVAIQRFLIEARGNAWVAEAEGRVVGALLAGQDGRRGYLYHLAVAEMWQRLGIGRRLVETALEELVASGIDRSHVMVVAENIEARAFWARLGWRQRDDLVVYSHVEANADAAAATDLPR